MAANTNETNTSLSYLMYKPTSKEAYEKLLDITDYPDMGSDPESLEVTTLTDRMQRFNAGIKASGALAFNANYIHDVYAKLAALEGQTLPYALWFGASTSTGKDTPSGEDGKFEFNGQLSVHLTGGGTNEVRKMAISIQPSSEIKFT